MKKVLIVLTKKYPYGTGETFIEAERQAWGIFDLILICPVIVKPGEMIRDGFCTTNKEIVVTSTENKLGLTGYVKGLFGFFSPIKIISEVFYSARRERLVPANIKAALSAGIKTNLRIRRVMKALWPYVGDNREEEEILLYSYWMYEPVLVGVGLKDRIHSERFITRAHGYDIYEERHPNSYIPFRRLVFNNLDRIYTISEDGKNYLNKKYNNAYQDKIKVSRLGTIKVFEENIPDKKDGEIVIASCAYMKPIKRLHLIIQALSKMNENVVWYHFGDGTVRQEIEEKARELPHNISAVFMGLVPNEEVQHFYATHYVDAFVNVSETEGIPVSIMEAQAYGIPAVATNVGGTSEIVHDHVNGILLDKDFKNEDLISGIFEVVQDADVYRRQSKLVWASISDARTNYERLFSEEFSSMNKGRP